MQFVQSIKKGYKKSLLLFKFYVNKFLRGIQIDHGPAFIVGCGHSGTSILLTILGTHSKIYAFPHESSIGYSKSPEGYLKYFDTLAVANGKSRWIEKTPKNIFHIKKLLEYRPNAKVILVVRDGRDVACSIGAKTGSVKTGIEKWVQANNVGQAYWDHPNVFVIKYEKIIEDFDGAITSVLNFLGESFESKCREFHKVPRFYYSKKIKKPQNAFGNSHNNYRNWQINQPLFDGRGKWKKMTEPEKEMVKEIGGEMLKKYGYTEDNNW